MSTDNLSLCHDPSCKVLIRFSLRPSFHLEDIWRRLRLNMYIVCVRIPKPVHATMDHYVFSTSASKQLLALEQQRNQSGNGEQFVTCRNSVEHQCQSVCISNASANVSQPGLSFAQIQFCKVNKMEQSVKEIKDKI